MITGIIIAAALVGGVGLFIGLFLGVAGKKFAVEVDEREIGKSCPAITAEAADFRDVTDWQQPLQREKRL
jgi:Na+-translocating ferredoxin:NAD+ oxidoreductase RNF subunit RnfB